MTPWAKTLAVATSATISGRPQQVTGSKNKRYPLLPKVFFTFDLDRFEEIWDAAARNGGRSLTTHNTTGSPRRG